MLFHNGSIFLKNSVNSDAKSGSNSEAVNDIEEQISSNSGGSHLGRLELFEHNFY